DRIATCASVAAVSIVVGEYSRELLPNVFAHPSLTASLVVVFFAWVQWRGIVWGDRTQQVTSLLKTLMFFGLIIAAFVLTRGQPSATAVGNPIATGVARTLPGIAAFVLAMQAVGY